MMGFRHYRFIKPGSRPLPPPNVEEVLVDLRNQAILDLNRENEELREKLNDFHSTIARLGWQEWNEQGFVVCSQDWWEKNKQGTKVLLKIILSESILLVLLIGLVLFCHNPV